jgi:hypothetical protein
MGYKMTKHNPDYEVYNPLGKDIDTLPVIYGFNNGGSDDWWAGQLLSEDGYALGSHICSSEGFMYSDLGIIVGSRTDCHEGFQKHYPEGYRMDFVPYDDCKNHAGLNAALDSYRRLNPVKEEV